ncbi:MAG: hypothetical protein IPL57_16685 [Rubrivivax sp.]|nr:hypothetical protein [Rubrivivax sp.]
MTTPNRPHRVRRPPPMAIHEFELARADAVLHRAIARLQYEGVPTLAVVDALLDHVLELAARQPGRPAVRRRLARALRDADELRKENFLRHFDFR